MTACDPSTVQNLTAVLQAIAPSEGLLMLAQCGTVPLVTVTAINGVSRYQ